MKKALYVVFSLILAAACIICVILLQSSGETENESSTVEESVRDAVSQAYAQSTSRETPELSTDEVVEGSGESEESEAQRAEMQIEDTEDSAAHEDIEAEEESDPYISPVDFSALQDVNAEIYAWLYIPDSEISFPVLQHDGNDAYYLTHDSEGNYDSAGAIFSEATFNNADFTDPVTVLYGHRRSDGTMFSQLQAMYSQEDGISTYPEIIIYLPDQELHYSVFAAVPFDKRHILYNYDFNDTQVYGSFLKTIVDIRDINAQFLNAEDVSTDDQLLILSTCLYGDATKRYLVLAKINYILK